MKPTQAGTYRNLQVQINQMTERLDELRQSAVTGKRMDRPSDDPAAIRPVFQARNQIRESEVNLRMMGSALDRMQTLDGQLGQMENILVRVKELAINSVNGSLDPQARTMLAQQVGLLRGELVDLGNTRIEGKYIFAGFAEGTRPFETNPAYDPATYDPADGTTWPVLYRGDGNPVTLELPPEGNVQVNLPGNALFHGDADNDGAVDAGGTDLFAVLTRIEEAMAGNDPQAVSDLLAPLDAGADQARLLRGRIGNTAQRVEKSMASVEQSRDDLQAMLSRYEDADLIKTLSDLTQQETAFETALQVTARISKMTILDYL